jgi:uncharacterized integral membrane protein
MAAILLVLAVLALVVLGDAIVENTASTDFTLFGQHIAGFTHGGSLAIAAALGALATCLLLLAFAASSRRRSRRKELRSSQHDLEDRIADLERENADLRTQPVGATVGGGTRPAPAAPQTRQAVPPEPPRSEPVAPVTPASAPPPPAAVHERPVAAPPSATAEQPVGGGATRMERLRGDAVDSADDRARPA